MSVQTSTLALFAAAGLAMVTPSNAFGQLVINTNDGTISPNVTSLGGVPISELRYNPGDTFFEVVLVGDATLTESIEVIGGRPLRIIVHGDATVSPEWNIVAVPGNSGGGAGGGSGAGGFGAQGLAGFPGLPGGAGGAGGAAGGFFFFDGYPGAAGAQGTGYAGGDPYSNAAGNNGAPGMNGGAGFDNSQSSGGSGGLGANRENFFFFEFPGGGGSGGDDSTSLSSAPGFPGGPGRTEISFANAAVGNPGAPGLGGIYPNTFGEPVGGSGGGGGGGGGGGASGLPGAGGTGGGGGGGGEGGSLTPGGRGGNGGQGGQGGTSGAGDQGGFGGAGGHGGGVIDLVVFGRASIAGSFSAKGTDGQAGGQPFGRTGGQPGFPGAAGSPGQDNFGSVGGRGGDGGTGSRGGDGGFGGVGGHGGGGAGGTVRVRAITLDLPVGNSGWPLAFVDVSGGGGPGAPGAPGGFKVLTSSPVVGAPDVVNTGSLFVNEAAGPAYDANPYVQGQPITPLLASTTTGPDHYGLLDVIDLGALTPSIGSGVEVRRIAGAIPASNGVLRSLASGTGAVDYLLIINVSGQPVALPELAIGDQLAGPLTPIPLATRGTADAVAGAPRTDLLSLPPFAVWATTLPAGLPADIAIELDGVRSDFSIGPGQIVTLGGTPPCTADLAAPFGTFNFFDLAAYVGLFNAGDPAADLAPPFGVINFFDVAAYIAAFNAGCP